MMKLFTLLKSSRTFIPFAVSLDPAIWKQKNRHPTEQIFPFNQPDLYFLYSGTAAIYQAVNAQGWGNSSEILCPSFNCGHELEPLLRAGITVNCYRVDRNLQIDLDHLQSTISERTRAVLIVHYFGFPQPVERIRKICADRGLLLIEDCAHSLFSNAGHVPLGQTGDLAVFSFRKSLPLPEGGGLLINNPELNPPEKVMPPARVSTLIKTLDLVKKSIFSQAVNNHALGTQLLSLALAPVVRLLKFLGEHNLLVGALYFDPDDERLDFSSQVLSWSMSQTSQALLNRFNPEAIFAKRRANFMTLAALISDLEKCRPVFSSLPAGVCPLYFPILVYNREELIAALQGESIFAAPWWEEFHPHVSWDDFPDAVFLKDHMIVLPIHQDINDRQLRVMAEALRDHCA